MRTFFFVFLIFTSCSNSNPPPPAYTTIPARNEPGSLYKIICILNATKHTPSPDLSDTRKPNAHYTLGESIEITVHTFMQHIHPQSQIERWKKQKNYLHMRIEPISFNGFAGLYFEGKTADQMVMAWSLQLDYRHREALALMTTPTEQLQSDVTIKIVGPKKEVLQQKELLWRFAKSLELNHPLTAPR